jgi:hypothetical protein
MSGVERPEKMPMSAPRSAEILYAERIVWGPSIPLSAVLVVVGLIQLVNQWIVGAVLLGTALLIMWFCVARYTVTPRGVDVRVGLGAPHLHVPAGDIASVDPTTLSFVTGWGYRGSWTLLRVVTVSLGGNGAVLITTRRGKRLQLTSRHPTDLMDATASLIE